MFCLAEKCFKLRNGSDVACFLRERKCLVSIMCWVLYGLGGNKQKKGLKSGTKGELLNGLMRVANRKLSFVFSGMRQSWEKVRGVLYTFHLKNIYRRQFCADINLLNRLYLHSVRLLK